MARALTIARRAFSRFRSNHMTDHAAALTYYATLSLFPSLLVGVSLLGLLGGSSLATRAADYVARHGADKNTAGAVRTMVRNLIETSSGAVGVALVVSLTFALNGASGAYGAAGRALNVVFGVEEDRSWARRKVLDIGITVALIGLFAIVVLAMFLGGGVADDLFGTLGLGHSAAVAWSILRWPVGLGAMLLAIDVVYSRAPDLPDGNFRLFSHGAAVGVVIWIVLSVAFVIYVRHFSSYGAVYGAFGAAIVLLLWLWLTANAFLFGAEINAEVERGRAPRDGVTSPPDAPAA